MAMTAGTVQPIRESYHAQVRHDVVAHVPKSGGTLLDIGGGTGATAAWLKRNGHAARAGVIDLVKPERLDPDIDFAFQGNLEASPLVEEVAAKEGPFDTILALDVLEHLVDPWAAVAKIHKALKPGGHLVASIPNVREFRASFALFFKGRWDYADDGILDRTHLRFFVRATAIELVASSGLRVERVIASPSGGRKVRLIRAATLGLFDSFTDRQYVIVARNGA